MVLVARNVFFCGVGSIILVSKGKPRPEHLSVETYYLSAEILAGLSTLTSTWRLGSWGRSIATAHA